MKKIFYILTLFVAMAFAGCETDDSIVYLPNGDRTEQTDDETGNGREDEEGSGDENAEGDNEEENGDGNDNPDDQFPLPSPNQIIYYTSTDGKIVEPFSGNWIFPSDDGMPEPTSGEVVVEIIRNVYENDQGVIICNKEVPKIANYAFYNCHNLESITLPDSVTEIEYCAFSMCENLKSITIPDSVATIGVYAFRGCSSLTSITIPDGVTEIGTNTFNTCSSLESITIPDSVTKIGESAFAYCKDLKSIIISESITEIGNKAFQYCYALTSITIPESVTEIGSQAFHDCSSLKTVYCKAVNPPSLDSYVFGNNHPDRKICVPQESVEAYKTAEGWKEYADDIVDDIVDDDSKNE